MVKIIAAVAANNVIGKGDELPWHLPSDLKRFKRLTEGNIVIMGRKTYDSIMKRNGKPLPNRINIVVSRTMSYASARGVWVTDDLIKAVQLAEMMKINREREIFVIGGASVYKQAIPIASEILLTKIHKSYDGDVLFPEFRESEWRVQEKVLHKPAVTEGEMIYTTFTRLKRTQFSSVVKWG